MPERLESSEASANLAAESPSIETSDSDTLAGAQSCSLRHNILRAVDDSLVSEWQSFHQRSSPDDPMQDIEWLRGYFDGQTDNVQLYSFVRGGRLVGISPFLRKDWPMTWHLGAWKIAQFPLKRLKLLGNKLDLPEDEAAYDLIFSELAKPDAGFDALYLEEIPLDSFLWKYLHRSELIRRSFLPYEPAPPSLRLLLRLDGSFEQYMDKFSSKHRKNLLREVKRLRQGALGEARLVRYESPEEVPGFLDQAFEVSRKTYQWTLYRRGLSATDLVRKRALFAAKHQWLRSYLLFCGGRACAFAIAYQYGGRFLLEEVGFDPGLAKHSVGTVLQLMTVEDLFSHNRPHVLDFHSYGKYKEVLSTESYLQGQVFLFRPGMYSRLLRSGHCSCEFSNRTVSALLDRMNLKTRLRQRLRGWSDPH